MTCTACNGRLKKTDNLQIRECRKCGAIHGNVAKGLLHHIVDFRKQGDENTTEARYFDLKVLASDGVKRVHGWYDANTRGVLQVG